MRFLPMLAACVIAAALTAGSAQAQSPTDHPTPGAKPGACVDHTKPSSGFTRRAARRASHRRVLRGQARDVGCGLDRVQISVLRKAGHRCRNLNSKRRLGRKTSCAKRNWLPVRGTSRWSFRLPRRLPRGAYVVRTRALDFAGNVQRPRAKRLKLR